MCLHIYSVYLVCRVLKNTYFEKHLSEAAPKYSMCSLMEKTLITTPVECRPNEKGIMATMEYTLMVYSANGKDMVL